MDNWRALDGWLVSRGTADPRHLSVDRFCNLVYYWATRNAQKPADVAKFDAQLWRPPPGAEPQGPWAPEAENAAFGSLKAALG